MRGSIGVASWEINNMSSYDVSGAITDTLTVAGHRIIADPVKAWAPDELV